MAIVLKEVTVTGFTIVRSVGRLGVNLPDDIFTIKLLLNGIDVGSGGSSGTLDTDDTSSTGPDFANLVRQIEIFQEIHFRGMFKPDGLVEPERNTIKRMRLMFKKKKGGGADTVGFRLLPDSPIQDECDLFGFSAARLSKSAGGDWTRRDPFLPINQMIPLGGTRKLRATGRQNDTEFDFFIRDEAIAKIIATETSAKGMAVTLKGMKPGVTLMDATAAGSTPLRIQLLVRPAKKLTLNAIHLGRPAAAGTVIATVKSFIFALNAIYQQQANLTFEAGSASIAERMFKQSALIDLSVSRKIFVSDTEIPASVTRPNSDIVSFNDLKKLIVDRSAVTIFLSPNIGDFDDAAVIGSSGSFNSKAAWFSTKLDFVANGASLPAHEIGHSLGLHHISVPLNSSFLMKPSITINNMVIPSDTLSDLSI